MHKSSLTLFLGEWLPRIEAEMREVLENSEAAVSSHYGMMRYHLGWTDEQFRPQSNLSGKRMRPILALLACAEMGGDPANALSAAAAIELLHNFSLLHDDIEDGDEMRRHRPTVWKIWGVPQAINAGDGMFTLAFAAMQRLRWRTVSNAVILNVLDTFTQTTLQLTEGQHLDMSFEKRETVSVEEYLRMIQGKTAALVGASVSIGARIAGATDTQCEALTRFGRAVGLAFQIRDDILGIWGDPAITGKPAGNDLLRRKKSYPILHTLNHPWVGEHFEAVLGKRFDEAHLPTALELLNKADALMASEQAAQAQHDASLVALREVLGDRSEESALWGLADNLLRRSA